MYNEDVLDLYPRASVGGKVTVTWQRFGALLRTVRSLERYHL
jgi:hypothetical protein